MAKKDRELHTGIVGEGMGKGTLCTGYLCKCGRMILGKRHLGRRGLARCVVCERVVVRKSFRAEFGEAFWVGEGRLVEEEEEEEDDDDGGGDEDGDEIQDGSAVNGTGENGKGVLIDE